MNIGHHIQQILKKQKLTQKALAEYLNIPKATLSNWLRMEKRAVPAEHIISICEFLKVSPYYLLTGKEKNLPSEQLSEDEQKILKYFKELPPDEQQQLIGMAMLLKEQTKSKNQEQIQRSNKSNRKTTKSPHIEMTTIRSYIYPVGAGVNNTPPKDDDYREIEIPSDFVPHKANSLIRVSGESMQPDFPDGCYIWVYMDIVCGQREDFYGKPVIANNNGELLLKIAGKDYLYSINEEFQEKFAGEGCTIIGEVIEIAEDKVVYFVENI